MKRIPRATPRNARRKSLEKATTARMESTAKARSTRLIRRTTRQNVFAEASGRGFPSGWLRKCRTMR